MPRDRRANTNGSQQPKVDSLESFLASRPPGDFFGDPSTLRASKATRVLFQNIHGINIKMMDEKQKGLFQGLKDDKIGIALLAEMNLNWSHVKPGQSWYDRVRQVAKRGHYSRTAHNEHQEIPSPSAFQWGGCSATLLDKTSHCSRSSGADPTGLGRWAWVKLRGTDKNREKDPTEDVESLGPCDLVVVAAYRPSRPGSTAGGVNLQQRAYLSQLLGHDVDPREQFTDDLLKAVAEWRSQGCEVIVGVDANEDVSLNHPGSIRQRFRDQGLREAILSRHHGPYPATQQCNTGNVPIDGIFVTPGVNVQAGGYYEFHKYFSSDHRGLWIDIDLWATLRRRKPTQYFQPRRLTTSDPRVVKRYIRCAEQGYLQYDIPRRLEQLSLQASTQGGVLTPRQQAEFDLVHSQAYQVRRKAERQCRKLKMGRVPWSPKLKRLWEKLLLWKLLLKGFQGVRTSSRKIRRLLKKTGNLEAWRLSEADVLTSLDDARRKYKNAKKKNASKWRTKFIQASSSAPLQAQFRLQKGRAQISRFQKMEQKEETRRRRCAQGKGFSGGLLEIKVQRRPGNEDDESNWVTCSTQRLVEDGCMRENSARYDQTRHPYPTPPMQEPLYSSFNGVDAESNSHDLLRGAFPSPSDDPFVCSFLNNCRRPEALSNQPLQVSTSDHVSFWQKMGEQKGSEPHGLHNGHFKAGITSSLLAECDTIVRQIPFSTGFVPAQWKHLMNFAIEKKPGEKRVTKMRTIQMMNSEFQSNNKRVGKAAMAYAEKHNLIPPGQFGSRKKHQAIDLALSKRLTWDLLLLQRRAAGWISNDAKSCFDRIVHWVAIISLMRYGIQWKTLRSMFDTLMQSVHRVRTGFGDSDRIFSPPSSIPYQGCGQGNGAGPTIWVAVSSILLGMMFSKGFGFDFFSAISWASIMVNAFAFVDDTDVCQAASSVLSSGEDIVPSIQNALLWWTEAIRLSGGAISPSKSFWWLIDFKWDPLQGVWRFCCQSDFKAPIAIRMKDLDGTLVSLTWLEPDQVERTLGVMMSPQSRADVQLSVLLEKANEWALTVSSGRLLRHDALPLLRTTILKTLEYPMALTTFSAVQWEKVLSKPLMAILPKAGICRTFPRAVVYAPLRRQGLGVPHPFGTQISRHLDMLLRHMANRTKTGDLLVAALEAHQLETGTSFGLFQQEYCNTAILTSDTWLKRVWHGLDSLRIHVELDVPTFEFRREGDQLLMDLFIEVLADQLSLKWLNWCRIYLHAVTLSDVVTADGRAITLDAWNGVRAKHMVDRYHWPRVERPAPKWWDVWREFLVKAMVSDPSRRRLHRPLGPWFGVDRHWRWQFSPSTGQLFQLHSVGWVQLPPKRHSRRAFLLPRTLVEPTSLNSPKDHCPFVPVVPSDCIRASVRVVDLPSDLAHRCEVILENVGHSVETPGTSPRTVLDLWLEYKESISGNTGWVPELIEIQGDESRLWEALLVGSLCIICDGSFSAGLGTACAQLCTESGEDVIWVTCRTPGLWKDQCSPRSELVGIMAALLILEWMCQLVKSRQSFSSRPTVEFGYDGLCALQKSFSWRSLKSSAKHFDVVSTIQELLRILPLRIQPRHVRGHADQLRPQATLSWWERRNMEVDQRAQAYRQLLQSSRVGATSNPRFFHEPASLFVHEVKHSRLDTAYILDLVSIQAWTSYWSPKGRLTPSNREEVDWKALGRAMHSFPPNLQRWTAKHTVDHRHVPRCRGSTATATWNKYHQLLRTWMVANSTAPEIEQFIFEYLRLLRSPTRPIPQVVTVPVRTSLLKAAVSSQLRIGVQGLLEGLLSSQWRRVQQAYFDDIRSPRSVDLWASRLIQQLILLGHHMWKNRNSVFHSETNSHYRPRHREVDLSITEQYRMGMADLPISARSYLREPIQKVLQRPLEDRENWLRVVSRARTTERRSLVRQRRMMYQLLNRRPPSSP